ncbi:MAG TPA: hypothetical protein VNY73_08855 [Bacteroidia bacterium]|nr:hypothetical protein [Bacteroidia bacterium]
MRYILLFIHALTITIYQLFFVDPVTIKTNFPESAQAGSQFIAEVTISKGSLAGFSKFQMELPEGLTAEESDSKGGTFSITGQTVKIIWTSVPSTPDVTVKFRITVKAAASGDKTIQGKYSYIENNVKQQVEFSPVTIKVEAGSEPVTTNANPENTNTVTPETTNTVAATTDPSTTRPEVTSPVVSVVRTVTPGKSANTYEVELKVKKDGAKGFAKLQEKIPYGYMATGQKAGESTFTFSSSDHIAKFIWTSLPAEDELLVTYKIMPRQGEPRETPAFVEGEFNYLDNQETKKYLIAKEELTGGSAEPVATNTPEPVNNNTPEKTNPETTSGGNTTEPVTAANIPKEGAVMYVVQVGAFKNGVNVKALSNRYGLSGVRTEMQDGFTKCITGKHNEYKLARDSRETIKTKGVSDAFVAAYNSGKRITVQEALMITSQKWYR